MSGMSGGTGDAIRTFGDNGDGTRRCTRCGHLTCFPLLTARPSRTLESRPGW